MSTSLRDTLVRESSPGAPQLGAAGPPEGQADRARAAHRADRDRVRGRDAPGGRGPRAPARAGRRLPGRARPAGAALGHGRGRGGLAVAAVAYLAFAYGIGTLDTIGQMGGGTLERVFLGATTTFTHDDDALSVSGTFTWQMLVFFACVFTVPFLLGARVWRAWAGRAGRRTRLRPAPSSAASRSPPGRSSDDGGRPRRTTAEPERGDHRAVVRAVADAAGCAASMPASAQRLAAMLAQLASWRRTRRPSRACRTPCRRHAAIVLAVSTSATASANDAATSCDGHLLAGVLPRLDPAGDRGLEAREREVVRRASPGPWRRSARAGTRIAAGSPSRASRSMCGPPGYGSPSRRPTLSNASPAASSSVEPSSVDARADVVHEQQRRVPAGHDERHDPLGERAVARARRRPRARSRG